MNGAMLDALHAELLGDLQEANAQLQKFRSDLPGVHALFKKDSDLAAAAMRAAFEDFHAAALALAEFIKLRKTEVIADIEQATVKNALTTKRALATFTKSFWILGALSVTNLVLVVAVLVFT